jgi:hypothetical protein
MTEPSVKGLSDVLKILKQIELLNQLTETPALYGIWKQMTKADWKEFYGLAGIQIFNYLNPRSQGIKVLISGHAMEVDLQVINGSFGVERNIEYTRYMTIAATLKNDESVLEICDRLMDITSSKFEHDVPFVFLEGSSGSGKSQMAFNIMSRLEKERECFYLLFEAPGSNAQKIYQNYTNISSTFNQSLIKDQNHYQDPVSPACGYLLDQSLYIYGFIFELLSEPERKSVLIKRMNGANILELMKEKNISDKRPIFLIDECILAHKDSLPQLRFVRNCFRSLGLGLVMLGTDSRAAQLPSNIGNSSRNDESRPWCYIFSSFPAANLDILPLRRDTPTWYRQILEHSRPLFSHFLSFEGLNNGQSFDFVLKTVFEKVVDVKKIFIGYYGPLGQIRLFQNAHSTISDSGEHCTALIHSHFAQLSGERKLTLKNDGCLSGQDQIWKPCSSFPLVADDVLLYLLLMGGKHYPAFRLNGCVVPYVYFLLNITSTVDHRRHMLDLSNGVQKSNDGNFLESLLCSTVCLASHCNGVDGTMLGSFLLNLIFQLQDTTLDPTEVTIGGLEKLESKCKMRIPFLSPPNMKWPEYFKDIPESNFGNLERARNEDRVDLVADCNIVGEAKDYGELLELVTLRKILRRIPKETKLHLVFTRHLRKSYFNRPASPFIIEFADSPARNMAYFKIDGSKPITSLEDIGGLPNTISENFGVVVFVLINKSVQI